MNISQHSALVSAQQVLTPEPNLLDGRSERQWLAFLAEYASLINFYDDHNTINGNWSPFLLKDPVFLMASISQTKVEKLQSVYHHICKNLDQLFANNAGVNQLSGYFNLLFDHITHVFVSIERWTFYMQQSTFNYQLKEFLFYQVKNTYSPFFWAIQSLRNVLHISKIIPDINAVKYYLFERFDPIIWQTNKDKMPYWDLLDLPSPVPGSHDLEAKEQLKPDTCYLALKSIGDSVFSFFATIVSNSTIEFSNVALRSNRFPDTTLLHTFVSLLSLHQTQLNSLSAKHLDFYYRDILKQKERAAISDKTYVCANAAKPNSVFVIPGGTEFNAGTDTNKQPVVFKNLEDVVVNPAQITNVITVCQGNALSGVVPVLQNFISAPSVLKSSATGEILAWNAFGGNPLPTTQVSQFEFAFASPLLLLREGNRTINVKLAISGSNISGVLNSATFYLSTSTGWFPVAVQKADNLLLSPYALTISLSLTDPPVEPIVKSTSGITSIWPMFKMVFNGLANAATPPVVTGIDLSVMVTGVKNFQLYNDSGALSTKNPFPLFGITPLVNSNFIIGSDEIFSKPLSMLCLDFVWDKLPDTLGKYYKQYNLYLLEQVTPVEVEAGIVKKLGNWLGELINRIRGKKKQESADPADSILQDLFTDFSFRVAFENLTERGWEEADIVKKDSCTIDSVGGKLKEFSLKIEDKLDAVKAFKDMLFTLDWEKFVLAPHSYFGYELISTNENQLYFDYSIQNTPLKFSDSSKSGFIRARLTGPTFGFGKELYPKVISDTALKNACLLAKTECKVQDNMIKIESALNKVVDSLSGGLGKMLTNAVGASLPANSKFLSNPNVPFTPKLDNLVANYSAKCSYRFSPAKDQYPLQCFMSTPMATFVQYDSELENPFTLSSSVSFLGSNNDNQVYLQPFLPYTGIMYLAVTSLLPANSFNLFFEFNREFGNVNESRELDCFIAGKGGWEPVKILSDTTNKFTCSGVLQITVPDSVVSGSPLMPGNSFWIAIATTSSVAAFSSVVLLQANGFLVQRSGSNFKTNLTAPVLPPNSITKPVNAIPEIASLVQPFSSFGGCGAETVTLMNQRVSNRIKTKDRAVSAEDYYRLIKETFPEIYDTTVCINKDSKTITVFALKCYSNWTTPGAFKPLLNVCLEEQILQHLQHRSAPFTNLTVTNYEFNYVQIVTDLYLKTGYEEAGIEQEVNLALKLYLSPWIHSAVQSITIGNTITASEVAAFISTLPGVAMVKKVGFYVWPESSGPQMPPVTSLVMSLSPTKGSLFVTVDKHQINFNSNL